MLLPFQGATAPTRDTQGVASLALGYVLHWAFSPPLLNPKLEFFIAEVQPKNCQLGVFNPKFACV